VNQGDLIDQLEIWGVEDGITLFRDGSFGFGFSLKPIDISCLADEGINRIRQSVKTLLDGIPKHSDIQFVQLIDRGAKRDIDSHMAMAKEAPALIQSLTSERAEKFERLDDDGHLPRQSNFLFLRIPLSKDLRPKRGILSFLRAEKKIVQMHAEDFEVALRRIKILEGDIEGILQSNGFQVDRVTPDQVIGLTFDSWNPGHPLGIGQFDESDLRDKILSSEVVKDLKGFRIGNTVHRVVTLKTLPEQTFSGMATALVSLPFSSRLYLSIQVPDQDREIEWLKLNRRMAYAMVMGKKGVSDVESEAKLQDLETLLNQVVQDGEKIFHASLCVVLRSTDEDIVDAQVGEVLQTIRKMSQSEGFQETYASFDMFAKSVIPNTRNKERSRRFKTSNLADLIPVYGQWSGFEKPSVLLRTRAGSLFKFDPFSSKLTNANQVISGGSGSGKSFLTNLLIGQMLSQDPRVFILDIGASYQKTCEFLEGQYINFSATAGLTINPFDIGEMAGPTDEKIKFLVALVEIMTKEDKDQRLGRLERAEIEQTIQELYKKEPKPRLSMLRELLLLSKTPEVARIGKILGPWCGDSPFGKIIDRDTNIEFQKRVVCFDLKGLESTPDLQAVSLFIITDFVWREVQRDRTQMKFVVFDECWKLLESDAGTQFIAEVFRTFRKYYASAIAISQNIDDFAKSRAATAVMPNSSTKWILKQKGADKDRLKTVLSLNEREMSLINSLTRVKGQFSEAFLMCEDERGLVSIESGPLEYWLATTDPLDFTLLKDTERTTGLKGPELLRHLAEHFPTGAFGK
jgi:conjugal transfer ATP-binding protein TraC